ncbi:MAG: acetyl-CoA C-acyltransferase [Porticoccaceae bacterium]|jgi:acetyl-CoA C-acetyltransferase|nr:acetyl-CoA C-acyltransferase [Porticoccaceae bacterium]MBT7564514.1 acetyl-CoA C-acyltransferase [Porticoccaceae bacterium]MBT7946357.1 acetyl-CoA C-acyltransferase [Porticoccaceae bacterium]
MREAVIVSTARTALTKAARGAFNNTHGIKLAAHSIEHAIARAGIDPAEVDDVILGNAAQSGTTGFNIARNAALAAGCPVTTSGTSVNRFCSSGLQTLAMGAGRIIAEGVDVMVTGGVESISLPGTSDVKESVEPELYGKYPGLWYPMIKTADIVADRYSISREAQDEYSLISQQRTAAGQETGAFDDEIVPMNTIMKVKNKETGEITEQAAVADKDDCNRPSTTIEGLASLNPIMGEDAFITAGNASQLSDGSSAQVLMERSEAERRGLDILGTFRGFAVGGCEPDEMGIGPVVAVPKLLKATGLSMDDIDLWELNEAFACQVIYSRDILGIPMDKLNVNGGSISIGHPFGMTGSRMVGHLLIEGRRRKAKYGVVTMCIGGGMGAAGLFEINS